MKRIFLLSSAILLNFKYVCATAWDDGLEGTIFGDGAVPTLGPVVGFEEDLLWRRNLNIPLANSTKGHGVLNARQSCTACNRSTPLCCSDGAYCCNEADVCTNLRFCCPRINPTPCGAQNCAPGAICCETGCCDAGTKCCGRGCCRDSFVCSDAGVCHDPNSQPSSASSNSSTISTPPPTSSTPSSDPPVGNTPTPSPPVTTTSTTSIPPPDTNTQTPDPETTTQNVPPTTSSSSPVQTPTETQIPTETQTTTAATTTESHTVQPHIITGQTSNTDTVTQAQSDSSDDAVALVLPNDPRINYDPPDAWTPTSSSSQAGSCHNGTMVTSQGGASLSFSFTGNQICLLVVPGSQGGKYSVQVDGSPGSTLDNYKDYGTQGDQCILSASFQQTGLVDTTEHNIKVVFHGNGTLSGNAGGILEFGGLIFQGPHATGTSLGRKTNTSAIIGGAVGGVLGGAVIIAVIVFVVIRRKRQNLRVDSAPAVNQATLPAVTVTPATVASYSAVPTAEYYDPYGGINQNPQYSQQAVPHYQRAADATPVWANPSQNQNPFGTGSYYAAPSGAGSNWQPSRF